MANQDSSFVKALARLNRLLMLDKKDIGNAYVFALLAGLVQLSLPLGIQSIINFVLAGRLSTSIVVLIALVVFGVFLNGLLQVRQLQVIEKVKQKLFVRYSLEYSDRVPRLNIERLDNYYLPEMVNRYFDSVSLQKGIDKLLIDLPAATIQVILGLILLSFYHPIFIAFGLVLIVIVLSIISFSSSRGLQTALTASSYKYGVAAWLQEIARSVKTFKYTKGTSLHMRKTDGLVSQYLDSQTSHFKILLIQFWSLISFKILIIAAMLIIGSYLLVNQQINVGQFIAADIVIIAIIASIEKIITNLDTIYDSLVSVEKLSAVTEAEVETSGNLPLPAKPDGVAVVFEKVSFGYGSYAPVLNDISFVVEPGQMVVVSGQSGAGKSTLLRLLTGAFRNYSGSILLDSIPLANYQIESLRRSTGILLGSQDIFEDTLWNNLTMGNEAIQQSEVEHLCELSGLIEFVRNSKNGFDTLLMPVGFKLPAKVRKNILLIRALLGEHRLLLLEEPFEHLSEPYRRNMINYIRMRKGATVFITSAHESLAEDCDRNILLNNEGYLVSIK